MKISELPPDRIVGLCDETGAFAGLFIPKALAEKGCNIGAGDWEGAMLKPGVVPVVKLVSEFPQ